MTDLITREPIHSQVIEAGFAPDPQILNLHGLDALFFRVLAASWQAAAMVVLIIVAQRLLGSWLNPRWRYALWLLVVLRLLMPVVPESTLSFFRYFPTTPMAFRIFADPYVEKAFNPSERFRTVVITKAPPTSNLDYVQVTARYDDNSRYVKNVVDTVLTLAWLAGAGVLAVLTGVLNFRFARQMARAPVVTDSTILRIFDEAKTALEVRRTIRLVESTQVSSPAIMGLFTPALLLPADVRQKFDDGELRLIFLHELAHLKRGDVIVQAIIAVLQVVHWFNPALWFAFRRMRIDREPATDALVLSRAGEAEKERYGLMLIKLLEHFNRRHSLATLVGILEDTDQFKQRFTLIARFTRGGYGWSLLGIMLVAFLGVTCLTKSIAVEPVKAVTKPSLVRIDCKIISLTEEDYQANRDGITQALQSGKIDVLSKLSSSRLLSDLHVLKKSPNQAVLERVRVMPYPDAYVKGADGKLTPSSFTHKDLGVRFVFFPAKVDREIPLIGKVEVSNLKGWKDNSDGTHSPEFNVHEEPINETFMPGQTKGFELIGKPEMLPDDLETYYRWNDPVDDKRRVAPRRIFYFITAKPEMDDKPESNRNATGAAQVEVLKSDSAKEAVASTSVAPAPQSPDIRVEYLVLSLPESDYAANRADIDAATAKGDYAGIQKLAKFNVVAHTTFDQQFGKVAVLALGGTYNMDNPILLVKTTVDRGSGGLFINGEFARDSLGGDETMPNGKDLRPIIDSRQTNFNRVLTPGHALAAEIAGTAKAPHLLVFMLASIPTDAKPAERMTTGKTPLRIEHSTPLLQALESNDEAHLALVRRLVAKGEPITEEEFKFAVQLDNRQAVTLFWDKGARYCSPLAYAIYMGKPLDEVKKLVAGGEKIDRPGEKMISPLGAAARLGNMEIVQWLLDHGADVNGGLDSPLDQATMSKQTEMVKFLLQKGAKIGEQTSYFAVAFGTSDQPSPERNKKVAATTQVLIDAGMWKQKTADDKAMMLLEASDCEEPEVVQLLIDNGADPLAPNPQQPKKTVIQTLREACVHDSKYGKAIDQAGLDVMEAALKKKAKPADSTQASPAPTSPDGSDAGKHADAVKQIGIHVSLAEIREEVYQANKAKFDAAVEKGNVVPFANTGGVSLLSIPSVSTEPGTKANVDVVREYAYPTSFAPAHASVPPTPQSFTSTNVGVSTEITPTLEDSGGKRIILNGKLSVKEFEGFTNSNYVGAHIMPSFTTRESTFTEAVKENESVGIWIPGQRVDVQNVHDGSKPDEENFVKKRMLLFVRADIVK